MTLQHDALPRSVGRIRVAPGDGGTLHGTGFLITPTRVLTCAHCLGEPGRERARRGSISFTQARDAAEVPFDVVFDRFDPEAAIDIAVLAIPRVVEGTACLTLSGEDVGVQPIFKAFGHPLAIDRAPLYLGGTVDGLFSPRPGSADARLLSLSVDGNPAEIRGMSGAPILTDGGVVGVLSHQLFMRATEGGARPAFSKAFAVPTRILQSIPAFVQSIAGRSKVFLAYRRKTPEAELVASLHEALRAAGHEPFFDLDIPVGEDWARGIQERIEQADAFVPILTPGSIESPMLRQEIRVAYARFRQTGRPILLPVRDPALATLPFELDTYVGRLQYAPWASARDTEGTTRAIVAATSSQLIDAPPITPDAPIPSLRRRAFQIVRPVTTALPPDDPFYFARPADAEAGRRVSGDKFVLTILSPSEFGKTSLALRLSQRLQRAGRPVAHVDFREFGRLPKDDGENRGYVTFLNDLARSFCASLDIARPSEPIESPPEFKEILLDALREKPRLVVILDGVDRVIERPYAIELFSSIRSWIDSPTLGASFILCIATEPSDLLTDISRSPFNIDKGPVSLGPFDAKAIAVLAERASYPLLEGQVALIHQATGGHPGLTRQALAYVLAPRDDDDADPPTAAQVRDRVAYLHDQCGTLEGPFAASLRALLNEISAFEPESPGDPTLVSVMAKIALGEELKKPEPRRHDKGRNRDDAARHERPRDEQALANMLVTFGLVHRTREPNPRFVAQSLAYARFFGSLS